MRWATRRHCHVDRAACAWLIQRFIDPEAEFVFVDDPDEVPADATPFDMRGVERRRVRRHLVGIVDEDELRLGIDEALDQPGAGGAIDVAVAAGRPTHPTGSSISAASSASACWASSRSGGGK